ncbi:MAG: 3-dehydroquinate synthase [Caldimonas sp.]
MNPIRVHVGTQPLEYEIVIGPGLLGAASVWDKVDAGASALVVTNTTVGPLHAAPVVAALRSRLRAVELIELPDGEAHKTWKSVERIVDALLALGADRKSLLVALGGGVVGDLTGFAAACYMRGIAYVQVPTTLLAQVDSSVGGKTGINHPRGKNLLGAFHQPRLVLADLDVLGTLPQRELIAGIAEVIKTAAVADAAFFTWLEANIERLLQREPSALAHAIERCCVLKATIVASDERESGLRAILNFGHTFGHAIEAGVGFGTWLHGEAVGCGMVLASDLSVRVGKLAAADAARITSLVERAGLPVRAPRMDAATWIEFMQHDKKVERGTVRFVLLDAIGSASLRPADGAVVHDVIERRAI